MERMALFIDSYDSIRYQALVDRLKFDAAILREEPRCFSFLHQSIDSQRRRHFSSIQHVQIYRSEESNVPLLDHRRTEDELKLLMNGLATGIPWMVNLSFRNVSKADLVVARDSGLFSQPEKTSICRMPFDEDCQSSTPSVEEKLPIQGNNCPALSHLQGIFVSMAKGEGVDDGFLEALGRLPKLFSASFWIEPDVQFSYPSLLSERPQSASDGTSLTPFLKTLNIQQDGIMSGWRNGPSFRSQTSTTSPVTLGITTHVRPLCRILESSNRTLRSLNLQHDLRLEGLKLMTNMVRINSTLRSLSISFCLPDEASNDEAISGFAEALRVNKTLVHLQNIKANGLHASQKSQQSLLDVLENSNYALRILDLCQEDDASDVNSSADCSRAQSFSSKKTLYLKLNFWDRQRFLVGVEHDRTQHTATSRGSVPEHVYVDLFHSIRDDLDCIFYFMSRNPSLVASACRETYTQRARLPKEDATGSAMSSVPTPSPETTAMEVTRQNMNMGCQTDDTFETRPSKRSRRDAFS